MSKNGLSCIAIKADNAVSIDLFSCLLVLIVFRTLFKLKLIFSLAQNHFNKDYIKQSSLENLSSVEPKESLATFHRHPRYYGMYLGNYRNREADT